MKIANIKSSLTVTCPLDWKKIIIQKAEAEHFTVAERGNILIIKTDFCLCIFEKKPTPVCEENCEKIIHINLTGVKNYKHFKTVLCIIQRKLLNFNCKVENIVIDNITGVAVFPYKINLRTLLQYSQYSKYDREKFPGVFLKLGEATAIIFESGKVNILGCKDYTCLQQAWKKVDLLLNNVCIKSMEKKTDT